MSQDLSVVGKRLSRVEGADKASGAAKYTGDIKLPGMLIGKVLRSPRPHAKILKIDISKAKNLPGVEAVITSDDVPREAFNANALSMLGTSGIMGELRDQHVLNDMVRYVGDAVAAVAAVDESTAEEALGLIEVEYEELPAVFDPLDAIKPDAPKVHDYAERNIAHHVPFPFPTGDVEKSFQEADHVVEGTFRTSKQKNCQLEPTTCVASFGPSGRLTVWSPCQIMHVARRKIADIFDIPEGMIRWLTPHIGGSFGARLSLTNEPICVALARKTGKPVRLEDTREEDLIVRASRTPFIQAGKLGMKKDGTITALQTKLIANAGAYFTHSGGETSLNIRAFMGLYRCPNMAGEADIVYTNTPASGGYRGYGGPQAMFALEQLIDMAAAKIGMDPVEFRLKNIKGTGEPSSWPSIAIENSALDECIKIGAERIGWKEKKVGGKEGVRRRGVGMACGTHVSNAGHILLEHSNAFIKFNADGSANLVVSPCEMGQGILTALAQIAAEELGLRIEDIHVVTGDTDITQFDIGSHASRSTYVIGNTVLKAAQEAKSQLLEWAAKRLGVSAGQLDIKDRRIYVKTAPEKGISITELAKDAIYDSRGECLNFSGRCSLEPGQSHTFQAVFVEVEVDTETGQVEVLKMVIAVDCGRAINPINVEGQIEGAALQGIGYALTEDFVVNTDNGVLMTDNFTTYKIPTTLNLPDIKVILVEQPVPSGPFGAKGVGELGCFGIDPAIANAIYDAVGIRVKELPITPEKILCALKAK